MPFYKNITKTKKNQSGIDIKYRWEYRQSGYSNPSVSVRQWRQFGDKVAWRKLL